MFMFYVFFYKGFIGILMNKISHFIKHELNPGILNFPVIWVVLTWKIHDKFRILLLAIYCWTKNLL
jgi:hypothetical protein